jgi:predicted ATPase
MSDASHSSGEARGQIVDFRGGSASGTGLPPQLTSFVGREREIPMVKGLMRDTRLLTLTGAGGSGKTRLARAVVSEVEGGFEDGVWWEDLAPLSDPDLVSHGVASVLAVYATPGRTLAQAIAEDLRELEILLVLDNCEHLVGACAELADELLRSCPGLRILATSREPLGLAIERSLVGQPLSVPWSGDEGVDELQRFESVRLFVERARYGLPGFTLDAHNARPVAEICRRLDGMPLAIELAAARVRVLSVEQISSRLENNFGILTGGSRTALPRHQTLRATIDWSHELLDPGERILFRRLSAFVWGSPWMRRRQCASGDGLESEEVLDLLTRLVDKSLILVAEQEGGEAGMVRRSHAEFFVDLAERAHPELRAANQVEWLARLEREDDNLRAALSWATVEDVEIAARLGWSLGPYWWIHTRPSASPRPPGSRWGGR